MVSRAKSWWVRQVLIFLAIFQLGPLVLVAFIPPGVGIPVCFVIALVVMCVNYRKSAV